MEVHDTAFVTCNFRAMHEALSGDPYARHWTTPKAVHWSNTYLSKVTPEESVAHSLRNRYFLETLKKLIQEDQIEYLINFGCGFSMYPFLLPERIKHIEIDFPHLIAHKKKKLESWQKNKKLPPRQIEFTGCDFRTDFTAKLASDILSVKGSAPCFILLEGVLFFLNREQTNTLFTLFRNVQNKGDRIGTVSFRPEDTHNQAFSKLLDFMNEASVNVQKGVQYQTVEDRYYNELPCYRISDHQDFFSLSEQYGYQAAHGPEMILNEQYYILQNICPMME